MKITIITVVYNCVDTIEQTIRSVLGQTYQEIEYIIIDGGSSDGTLSVIKKYENQISKWVSESDNGIYHAMNKGVLRSSGDYIQFLNADDFFVDKYVIEKVVNKLKKFSPDVLSFPVWVVDEKLCMQKIMSNKIGIDEIKRGHNLPHQGIFMKADILKEYKLNEKYKIASDFELILRCAINGKKIYVMDEPIVYFGGGGISGNYPQESYEEYYQILCEWTPESRLTPGFKKKMQLYLLIKHKLRNFLETIKCMKAIRRIQGWQRHHCTNEFCRWCKFGEKTKQ